ncbi:cytosine permease [Phytopseudomonas daroniae]|uniref:cytosine permease n=1 Tax=Phytopseudomonas daroniae TaxID=2487519 RepID=UPI001FCA262B|nr:cytosine permease [Pseudomonas daroniae]
MPSPFCAGEPSISQQELIESNSVGQVADFYLVQKQRYHIPSLFDANGGIYGRFNPNAVSAYAVGILVQLPFAVTPIYTGPMASKLDGADLSWLVAIVVPCLCTCCCRAEIRCTGVGRSPPSHKPENRF